MVDGVSAIEALARICSPPFPCAPLWGFQGSSLAVVISLSLFQLPSTVHFRLRLYKAVL